MHRRTAGGVAAALAMVGMALVAAVGHAASAEGQLDLSFGSCGESTVASPELGSGWPRPQETGRAVAVRPDGKILLAGNGSVVQRLPDGTTDYAFGAYGTAYTAPGVTGDIKVVRIAVQPDGRILLGGTRSDYQTGSNAAMYLTRLLPSGAVDPSFGVAGNVLVPSPQGLAALVVQPDGKIVAAGGHSVVRLQATGAPDPAFGAGGTETLPEEAIVADAALEPSGGIVVGVSMLDAARDHATFDAFRVTGDGSPERLTDTGVVAQTFVALAIDGVGRSVSAGTTYDPSGHEVVVLVRRLASGALDPAFGDAGVATTELSSPSAAGWVTTGWLRGLAVQADGKPVLALELRRLYPDSGEPVGAVELVRLTVDGEVDAAFARVPTGRPAVNVASGVYPQVGGLAMTPSGGFAVGATDDGGTVFRYLGAGETGARASVTLQTCRREVSVTPWAVLDYGTPAGMGSTPRRYTVANTGAGPVRVGPVAFVQTKAHYAAVGDGCTGVTLAPGAACSIVVRQVTADPADFSRSAVLVFHGGRAGHHGLELLPSRVAAQPASGWGWNAVGQVGAGPPTASETPVEVGLPNAVAVASGYFHSLAVRADGTVWAWGWNALGQLGDGTTVDRATPAPVPGLAGIVSVAAGAHSSFAVTADGAVYAWGWNGAGQLGDGTTVDRHAPVRLTGLPPMALVSGGPFHTLAVDADGGAWAWGLNTFGELGDGTVVHHAAPTRVTGLDGVRQVAAGAFHSLAVTYAGSVRAWGWNGVGQLGDGTTVDHAAPAPVPGLAGVVSVAAGAYHSLALAGDQVKAWGWNGAGQLGDGTTSDRHAPVAVGPSAARTVAAGAFHSLATSADGLVWAWGWNGARQLAVGSAQDVVPVAARIRGLAAPIVLSGGYAHSLAG